MTKIPREEGAECGLGVGTPVEPAQTHPLFLSFQSTQLDHLLVVFLCHVWQSVGGRTGLAGWDGNLLRPRRVREGMRKSKEEQRKKDRTQIAAQTGFVGFSRSLRWLPGVAGGFATAPRFPLAGAERLVLGGMERERSNAPAARPIGG